MTSRSSFAIAAVLTLSLGAARTAAGQDSTLVTTDSATYVGTGSRTRPANPSPEPVPTSVPAGPTIAGSAVAAHVPRANRTSNADALAAMKERQHHGSAVALMVVGGVAILVGVIAGGDVSTPLVLGGTVVGLIGLYQYLL